MEIITSPEAAKALLDAHMRRGVLFSRSFSAAELALETEAGTLFGEEHPGCLLLARRRGAHQILSFALDKDAALPSTAFDRPTVLELAWRDLDPERRLLVPEWEKRGFVPVLRRLRLAREKGGMPLPLELPRAAEADLPALRALLEKSFDPLTGCLPTDAALAADVESGHVLFDGAALLRFSSGFSLEIRQLAVAPEKRGQGRARALLERFTTVSDSKHITVWTAETNIPALRLYERCGFSPDGWKSVVLVWKEQSETKKETHMRERLLTLLGECCPGIDFEHETALIDDGLLESLDVVTIASEIMGEFDVRLRVDDLLPENFNSLDALLALIERRQ